MSTAAAMIYIDTTLCEGEGPAHATTFVTDGRRIAALPAEHADLDDVQRDGDLVRIRCGGRASDPEDQCTSTHHLNLATDWIPAHPEWLAALDEHGEDLPA